MPEISIIIPCYNQSSFLDECLQSVLDQTYQDWECIIVDDGSPDNTGNIAKNWIEKDSRFKYYKKINGGVSSARNYGIKYAQGNWILALDGDDKIANRYLELASKEFYNDPDIIYCIGNYFGTKQGEIILDDFNIQKILLENQIFCTAFFKKKDWQDIGGFDESMNKGYEDWEFWISLIALKKKPLKVKKLDYLVFFYRIKDVSRNTQAMDKNDIEIRKYLFAKHNFLYQEHIEFFSQILRENRKLKIRISQLEKVLNSKRYLFIDKIFKLLKR